jgi:ribosomal protein S17
MATPQWSEAAKFLPAKILTGRVVNAGERLRTVRVQVARMEWNKRVKKVRDRSSTYGQC